MRTRLVATLTALLCLAAVAAHAAEARAVLERFLARAAATPLRDLTIEQDLVVFNSEGRTPYASGSQRVVFKLPDRQRIDQTIDGKTEVRLTVGGRTWRRGPDGAAVALPSERGHSVALAVPVHRSADGVLAEWRALGVRDDRSHETRLSGRPVAVIGAQRGERDRPAVWLDEEHGVLRFVARETAESGTVFTDVVFSDHRPLVGALFFPYRQDVFRGGKLLARVLVRSLLVNSGPSDALFDPANLAGR